MTMFSRLRKREAEGLVIGVAIIGTGLIGRGILRQVDVTPGMRSLLAINRRTETAVQAFIESGHAAGSVVVSDDVRTVQKALDARKPVVTSSLEVLREVQGIDCAVECTGAVEYGVRAAIAAIEGGKHLVMMNAEADATVGCALKHMADAAGVVYTVADGDQPGVLMRMVEFVRNSGFDPVAAINCKGFMDLRATPDSIRPWATKQKTSLSMTTAMADGTKMNIEQAVLANATGLLPEKRGMHGVRTDLKNALRDCLQTFQTRGVVDYTLGGDFGGGVFVIGHAENPIMVQPYMQYLKMGDGPYYLFFRPYHLCHLETPLSVAEAAVDGEPTIAPLTSPVTEVVAIAKRDLKAGETLDGIGGFMTYGQIDVIERTQGLLPIGLTEGPRLLRNIRQDEPIPAAAVDLDADALLVQLHARQSRLLQSA